MCKEVKNEELELNESTEQEQNEFNIEDLPRKELIDMVYSLLSQKDREIEVNTNNVQDIEINKKEFKAGIDAFSFVAGAYSVLNSVGYPKDLIHEMIINRETIEHNQELQRMNNKSSENIAKTQQVKIEQSQI